MTMSFQETLEQHLLIIESLSNSEENIITASDRLLSCLRTGHKILICGNGGSAANAQHMAAELVVRYEMYRPAFSAIALTTDTSILTAHSNDYSFITVFARQVEALGREKDCLIAISTSGDSENICEAAKAARRNGLEIIGLTGHGGGRLAELCDITIIVKSTVTARIQEAHELIIHWFCDWIERNSRIDA